jgi:HlyD family secretion protein
VNKWARLVLTVAIGGGVVGGGVAVYKHLSRPPDLVFHTVTVDRGPIVARVNATGTLSAKVTVQVGAQVSGRLSEILVDYNSEVKKNQVIARLDPELYKAALAASRANTFQSIGVLQQYKATLVKDQKLAERAKLLKAQGLMAQQDYDNAIAQVDIDAATVEAQKGQVEQNRANEHQAEINLAYCTIFSPIDGTVIVRAVDVGQTVAASLTAPTLFTIAQDLHKMQVDTNVTEGDVGKLRDGMRASFSVDAYPNERFNGTVLQIRNAATTVQNVVTYDAVIEVENTELKLRPGMTANATFNYDRRENVLRVPNSALRFRAPASMQPAASAALSAVPPSDGPGVSPVPPPSAAAPAPAHSGSTGPGSGEHGSGRGRRGQRPPVDSSIKLLWVMRGPKPVPVVVHVGLTDGTTTEIVSGEVNEGDEVVLEVVGDEPTAKPSQGGGNQPPRMRL